MNSPKKTKKVTSGSHLIAFISLSLGFSGSSGFEGISRTNGNRKPVWAMITA
jgi:hypothetical protein